MSYTNFMTGGALAAVASMELASEAFKRSGSEPGDWLLADAGWIDGGYCIDAPGTCLAGSMLNVGAEDTVFPFPSFYERF